MNAFVKLLQVLLIFAGAIWALLKMAGLALQYKPGTRKSLAKDLSQLRQLIGELKENPIALKNKDLGLLRRKLDVREAKDKKRFVIRAGVLKTIYDEPVVLFALKYYPRSRVGLLLAKTAHNELLFHATPELIRVYVDNQMVGEMSPEGTYFDPSTNQIVAYLRREGDDRAIMIGNREAAVFDASAKEMRYPARAFKHVAPLDKDEFAPFVIMTLYDILLSPMLKVKRPAVEK